MLTTILIVTFFIYSSITIAMEKYPTTIYQTVLSEISSSLKEIQILNGLKIFNKEKRYDSPREHVVEKKVLSDLENLKNDDYVGWIGHATFLIKLGNNNITDQFSPEMPVVNGPKRFTKSIKLE